MIFKKSRLSYRYNNELSWFFTQAIMSLRHSWGFGLGSLLVLFE